MEKLLEGQDSENSNFFVERRKPSGSEPKPSAIKKKPQLTKLLTKVSEKSREESDSNLLSSRDSFNKFDMASSSKLNVYRLSVGSELNKRRGNTVSQQYLANLQDKKVKSFSLISRINRLARQYMQPTQQQILATSDVTIQTARQIKMYSVLNFLFYLGQLFVLLFLSTDFTGGNSILNWGSQKIVPQSPLFVSQSFWLFGWLAVIMLQGFFTIRGLMCDKASVHYQNCVLLKIKFNFVLFCTLLTLSFVSLSILVSKEVKPTLYSLIMIGEFTAIKCK